MSAATLQLTALQAHDAACLPPGGFLVGVDEAGRGALAGPVHAAACVLGADFLSDPAALALSAGINDSKQLTAAARAGHFAVLEELRRGGRLDFAVAAASVAEIEALNILGATRLAMRRALEALAGRAAGRWALVRVAEAGPLFATGERTALRCLVDGRPLRPFPYEHEGLVKGDARSLAIAMASIAAKVTRDDAMAALDRRFDAYGFGVHKGYGTVTHRAAIRRHGPCSEHRLSFLAKILGKAPKTASARA